MRLFLAQILRPDILILHTVTQDSAESKFVVRTDRSGRGRIGLIEV